MRGKLGRKRERQQDMDGERLGKYDEAVALYKKSGSMDVAVGGRSKRKTTIEKGNLD